MGEERETIFLEDAEVLAHEAYAGEQHILRVQAPRCAARARPGAFAHLTCDPALPMRRPFSIMRAAPEAGWVEYLYKVVGAGTRLLAQRRPGDRISHLGPIGHPFALDPQRPRALLVGGGVGIPPMVFLAETMRRQRGGWDPLVLMGSEVPFPFKPRPSKFVVAGMPPGAIAAMPLMEDWGIPSRLASAQGFPGCHEGPVTEPAQAWLAALDPAERREVTVYGCGPHPMLERLAAIAREHGVACQVALEELMACAVGGCAGCAVETRGPDGRAVMRRVCVDGPVFDAREVFF
ncbi:MAG: dihydroorotate dehydrogenase electron transfer subunit [Gammaproteobacteria bacterium]|nr:dihydroorotate dehydrogenase electron transfer subunit [Gammaproteobacteria bacterium]